MIFAVADILIGSRLVVKDHSERKNRDAQENYQDASKNRELKLLLNKYYKAYAEGDISALKAVASPFSDREISYVKFMAAYVDACIVNEIYTKPGDADGELLVSAYVYAKYRGVYEKAPSLDFFYVRVNRDGKLYIDNRYSLFNQQNGDMDVEENVAEMINTFELQEDVIRLKEKVQAEYDDLMANDSQFNNFFTNTLPEVITQWVKENQ